MACPVCGAECIERSGGENFTVIDCPSCHRLPLWRVGLLAVTTLPGLCVTRVSARSDVAVEGIKRVATRLAALSWNSAS